MVALHCRDVLRENGSEPLHMLETRSKRCSIMRLRNALGSDVILIPRMSSVQPDCDVCRHGRAPRVSRLTPRICRVRLRIRLPCTTCCSLAANRSLMGRPLSLTATRKKKLQSRWPRRPRKESAIRRLANLFIMLLLLATPLPLDDRSSRWLSIH